MPAANAAAQEARQDQRVAQSAPSIAAEIHRSNNFHQDFYAVPCLFAADWLSSSPDAQPVT